MKTENDREIFYAAAFGQSEEDGIYAFELNGRDVKMIGSFLQTQLRYIIVSASGKNLYAAVRESTRFTGDGELASFAIESDGTLRYLNSLPSGGQWTCHIMEHDGFIYAANYLGGNFVAFKLNDDGSLRERCRLISHHGSSINERFQSSAHPHCMRISPDGKFLTVSDLGNDSIYFYYLNKESGCEELEAKVFRVPAGSGPRHLVYHPDGRRLYVNYQVSNQLAAFEYSEGQLKHLQTFSSLPESYSGYSENAALRLSKDAKTLLVSNRGHESLAAFRINPDGSLLPDGFIAVGKTPWDCEFLSDGRIITACAGDDSLEITGLHDDAERIKISLRSPVCIAY